MITNTKLDPIETASVDELQALQTQRLKPQQNLVDF